MLGNLKMPDWNSHAESLTTQLREFGGATDVGVVDLLGTLGISPCSHFPLENNVYFGLSVCFFPIWGGLGFS